MSRNLCRINCKYCQGKIDLLEDPRPIEVKDTSSTYFDRYEGMIVANARCHNCEAEYLAWVDRRSQTNLHPALKRTPDKETGILDLSYRSTFNDEPGESDLPKYKIAEVVIRFRVGKWDGDWEIEEKEISYVDQTSIEHLLVK